MGEGKYEGGGTATDNVLELCARSDDVKKYTIPSINSKLAEARGAGLGAAPAMLTRSLRRIRRNSRMRRRMRARKGRSSSRKKQQQQEQHQEGQQERHEDQQQDVQEQHP